MASYLVGIDIGGTFTDCVVICERGQVVTAKAPSTPGDYSRGVLDAITAAGRQLGHTLPEICRATRLLSHATTIGTNAVIEKRGARVGIITTKGHNDVIHIMRGSRGLSGRDLNQVVHGLHHPPTEPEGETASADLATVHAAQGLNENVLVGVTGFEPVTSAV